MAIKSIIDIDVNDKAFKQFNSLFQQYTKTLNATPLAWKRIAQGQQEGVKWFKELVQQQVTALGQAKLMAEVEKRAALLTRIRADAWRDMARSTKGVAVNIKDMTTELMRWSVLTGTISGVLGAGGLFGISRLSETVATGRRGSLGIGATYGQQKAFGTNFSRLVDPDAVLSGVNSALTNVSNRVNLYNAGLREGDLGGGSAAVSVRLLEKVKALADQTPDNLLGNIHQVRGLGNLGISPEDFQRIKATPRSEIAALVRGFGSDTQGFGVGAGDQRAFQDLNTQLNRAATQIETVFVRGLAPLIPDIAKLSDEVVNLVKAFSESDILKDTIHDLTDAMKGLVEFVKNPWQAAKAAVVNDAKREGNLFVNDFNRVRNFFQGQGNALYGGHGLTNVKPGAGTIDPGLGKLAEEIQGRVPGINRFTAFNDDYHKGTNSAHADNRAFDLTITDPSQSAFVAALIRSELVRMGVKGTVIDEYRNPSSRATAGHIHVQTDVKVMNAAGSSVIVSTQQATPTP